MDVDIRAWVRTPIDSWATPKERVQEIEELKQGIDFDQPELVARFAALSVANEDAKVFLNQHTAVALQDYPTNHSVLLYIILYKDAFETQYPRKPRSEWFLGHTELAPEGNWK